ncbi:PaREP6 [Thermofilum adornatum 1505]|uniref:PaREP6 n=1 Tax=Thermofilum adornatum 1505 TaxID=697581 RepID=A0A3G1A912_9CREN|nr:hypothetical protein [Thermofilum adornatum]AJB41971.1 PaREP6 [Thermofilum adornatum 1505]
MEKNNIIEELKKREEKAIQIRRKQADWNYINNQPTKLKLALVQYIDTGDLYVSAKIAGITVEEFNETLRKARVRIT